jgi:DNA polymerase III subunit gamma/tau
MATLLVEKYQPLYLKHRPQSLSDLVGQNAVLQTLTNALAHDRISHAYLFTGPRGTGKTSSARILAKSLNCEKGPTATPCLTCTACIEIKNGTSPAVFELDAASNNSVDDARALIERAPLVAEGGRYKLYIIDECHMLTKEAFNALLKTIEEPPKNVVFILATTEEHKVPATIVSRCQRLMFRLVNQKELKEHLRKLAELEEIYIADDALELIARRSAGGLRDALGLLDQASLLSSTEKPVEVSDLLTLLGAVQEDVLLKISAGVAVKDGSAVLQAVHSLLAEGREPAVLIQELAKHFLNLAKACYNNTAKSSSVLDHSILGSAPYLTGLAQQAKDFEPAEIAQIVELLDKLEQTCRRSSQPALNLEMGVLSICHRHDIALLKEVQERLVHIEKVLSDNDVTFTAPSVKPHPPADKYASERARAHQLASNAPVERTAVPAVPPPLESTALPTAPPPLESTAPPTAPPPIESTAPPTAPPPIERAAPPINPAVERTAFEDDTPTPHTVPSGDSDSEVVSIVIDEHIETVNPSPSSELRRNGSSDELAPAQTVTANHQPNTAQGRIDTADEPTITISADFTQSTPVAEASSMAQSASRISSRSEPNEEFESTEDQGSSLAEPADDTPAKPGSRSAGGSDVSLDELWSDLKDELQRRHLPTFGVVQTYAFPLNLEKDDLTVGVRKEMYQKMVENKGEHIKAAFTAVTGRLVSLRVKVVNDTNLLPTARPKSPNTPSPKEIVADDSEESHRAPRPGLNQESSARTGAVGNQPAQSPERTPYRSTNSEQNQIAVDPVASSQTATATLTAVALDHTETPTNASAPTGRPQRSSDRPIDPSLIQEAYKLFEGPGSRLIG